MTRSMDQNLVELERTVERRVGLMPTLVSGDALRQAVLEHMAETAASSEYECVDRILANPVQFKSFVEKLVVPETWFFRDRQPFHFLHEYATQYWRSCDNSQPLRILSLPCSSGEEPYSIAMTLLGAGLSPNQFKIDAADLSQRLLARARRAKYQRGSFRGDEQGFSSVCERYLEPHESGFAANAQLRAAVHYFQENLVSPNLLASQPKYHFVFCRNVLIYLGADARHAALANLHRLLLPDGALFAGLVEARTVSEGPFVRFSDPSLSAFRPVVSDTAADDRAPMSLQSSASCRPASGRPPVDRNDAASINPHDHRSMTPTSPTTRSVNSDSCHAGPTRITRPLHHVDVDVDVETVDTARLLANARSAADAGRIEEARQLCQKVLVADPANANAFYLMGLAAGASGRPCEAEAHYRRALYIDPKHEESLVHLVLLAEQRGDIETAANYRRRARQIGCEEGN